jgi:hypothetical protein
MKPLILALALLGGTAHAFEADLRKMQNIATIGHKAGETCVNMVSIGISDASCARFHNMMDAFEAIGEQHNEAGTREKLDAAIQAKMKADKVFREAIVRLAATAEKVDLIIDHDAIEGE